jgi:hypothetical protein
MAQCASQRRLLRSGWGIAGSAAAAAAGSAGAGAAAALGLEFHRAILVGSSFGRRGDGCLRLPSRARGWRERGVRDCLLRVLSGGRSLCARGVEQTPPLKLNNFWAQTPPPVCISNKRGGGCLQTGGVFADGGFVFVGNTNTKGGVCRHKGCLYRPSPKASPMAGSMTRPRSRSPTPARSSWARWHSIPLPGSAAAGTDDNRHPPEETPTPVCRHPPVANTPLGVCNFTDTPPPVCSSNKHPPVCRHPRSCLCRKLFDLRGGFVPRPWRQRPRVKPK